MGCGPRQLSALLNLDFGLICNEMTEIEIKLYGKSSWCEKGMTPRMVIDFCKLRNLGCAIMHNGSVLETVAGPNPIVAALHENQLYLYRSAKTRKRFVTWKSEEEMNSKRLRQGSKLQREHAANASTPLAQELWV